MKIDFKKNFLGFMIFSMIFAFIGCPNNEDKPDEEIINSSERISVADFTNVNPDSISSTEIISKINDADFYDNEPISDSTTASEEDTCWEDKFQNLIIEKDGADTYKISVPDTSMLDCIVNTTEEISGMTVTFHKAVFSISMSKAKFVDSNGTEIDAAGKKIFEIDDSTLIIQNLTKMYAYFSATIKLTSQDLSSTTDMSFEGKWLMVSSSDSNAPCLLPLTGENNCIERHVTIGSSTTSSTNDGQSESSDYKDLSTLEFNTGLLSSTSDTYFTNGAITFQLNNWNGTMTYDSDAETPPTFSVSDPLQTICGTFGMSTASQCISSSLSINPMIRGLYSTNKSFKSLKFKAHLKRIMREIVNESKMQRLHQ